MYNPSTSCTTFQFLTTVILIHNTGLENDPDPGLNTTYGGLDASRDFHMTTQPGHSSATSKLRLPAIDESLQLSDRPPNRYIDRSYPSYIRLASKRVKSLKLYSSVWYSRFPPRWEALVLTHYLHSAISFKESQKSKTLFRCLVFPISTPVGSTGAYALLRTQVLILRKYNGGLGDPTTSTKALTISQQATISSHQFTASSPLHDMESFRAGSQSRVYLWKPRASFRSEHQYSEILQPASCR